MTDDDRRTCVSCENYRGWQCVQFVRARMPKFIGTTLANLPQRCPAFKAKQ